MLQVGLDQLGLQVTRALQEPLVGKDHQVLPVQQVTQVLKVLQEGPDQRELQVTQVLQVLRVEKDLQVLRAQRVLKVL